MPATPMSWAPLSYDPTKIDNDGTFVNRYDGRKTLAYVTEHTNNVNNEPYSVFMFYWITTKCGKKYHLISNAGLRGSQLLGTFISLDELQDLTSRRASILYPGSGNHKLLELKSATQNITSPEDGDQWTNTHLDLDFVGTKLDVTLRPTGGSFYYGGGSGIQVVNRGPDPDGVSLIAFASVWHPNSRHEMLPIGPKSRASDISVSPRPGLKYFNTFFLDLPCRNAHFTFDKWVRDGELNPAMEEQRDKYNTISESYGEGTGMWDDKQVLIQGHVEQLSMMR
ncbi:hydroxyneurosporene synthase [Fusarium coicis]|nr:hydroxyneurosporene synthase [Fusarium coicis]